MADYFPATIYIGGVLPTNRLVDLFEAVTVDGVITASGEGIADEADLRAQINGTGPLALVDAEASFGELTALEAACQELGLTFRRESDARYEYEAEIVSWTPGMAEPRWTRGSQDGTPVIAVATVRKLLDAAASDVDVVARLRAEIARHTPVEVPPLVLISSPATT